MSNKIALLAKGEALKEKKAFSLNVKSIKETLNFGKIYKGSFLVHVFTDDDSKIIFKSSNHRIKIVEVKQTSKETECFYTIDTNGLKTGDILEGKINVLSDGVESQIDLYFDIDYINDNLIIHSLNTKEDFYNLFTKNPETVVRIFKDKNFCDAPFMDDLHLQMVYTSLIKCDNVLLALKEFFNKLGFDVNDVIQIPSYKDDLVIKDSYFEELEYEHRISDLFINELEDIELIEQIVILLIRAGIKNDIAFKYYEKAIINHLNITKLFEYFLYSVPKKYKEVFPKEVYLYYSTNKDIPYDISYILFVNIAKNLAKQSDIFKMFEMQMKEMAIDYLSKNQIDDELSCLYDKIITEDMITPNIANVLVYILRYFKIEVLGSDIKNIIIKYEEINGENVFPVHNGVCYATIFFNGFELIFEDKNGNRFASRNNRIRPMLDRPELEEACYKLCPDIDILKLARLRTILQEGINSENELLYSIKCFIELDLTKITHDKLQKLIFDYITNNLYSLNNYSEDLLSFINSIDKNNLTKDFLKKVFQIYILAKDYTHSYEMIKDFNINYFDVENIKSTCIYCINNENEFDKDVVCEICVYLVNKGIKDDEILKFLVENYDIDTNTMYYILQEATDKNINTFILAKKLLTFYLIIDEVKNIEFVFNEYSRYKTDEEDNNLIYAYVTRNCIGYFLYERELPQNTILPLENIIFSNLEHISQVPKIYLFSISKYLSFKDVINPEERKALIILSDHMLSDRIVFEWTKELYKFIDMKEELANAEYIEYHAKNGEIPKAFISINDGKEIEYELFNIYKNIYVRPILIFKNESIKYKIFNVKNIEDGVLKEGLFVFDPKKDDAYVSPNQFKSSFKFINEAIELFEKRDLSHLKQHIKEMITMEGMTKELFNI